MVSTEWLYCLCSLFGIVGVTDKSLEALSNSCSNTITTLDVNGCIGIKVHTDRPLQWKTFHHSCFLSGQCSRCCKQVFSVFSTSPVWLYPCLYLQRRSRDELLQLFPKLKCFKVHSWGRGWLFCLESTCYWNYIHLLTFQSELYVRCNSRSCTICAWILYKTVPL